MAARTCISIGYVGDHFRRILPAKVRPGKRRLTEPTAAAQPGQVPLGVVEAPRSDGSANFARSGS
jgi:hypothetical protein